jgi:anti-anti-sigma factor
MNRAEEGVTKLTVESGPQGVDGVVVVAMRGSGDIHCETILQEALADVAKKRPRRVILDLRGLDILTSLAIGVLVGFRARVMHEGGSVVMTGVAEPIVRSMRFTRVSELFQRYATVDEARAGGR